MALWRASNKKITDFGTDLNNLGFTITDDETGNELPIRDWPGHSNHFHIRIADPDGSSN
jgi:hypothetical protein